MASMPNILDIVHSKSNIEVNVDISTQTSAACQNNSSGINSIKENVFTN
jgi:hypothetical protein